MQKLKENELRESKEPQEGRVDKDKERHHKEV